MSQLFRVATRSRVAPDLSSELRAARRSTEQRAAAPRPPEGLPRRQRLGAPAVKAAGEQLPSYHAAAWRRRTPQLLARRRQRPTNSPDAAALAFIFRFGRKAGNASSREIMKFVLFLTYFPPHKNSLYLKKLGAKRRLRISRLTIYEEFEVKLAITHDRPKYLGWRFREIGRIFFPTKIHFKIWKKT